MNSNLVNTERRDGVLVISMSRSEAKNAINQEMSYAIAKAVDLLDEDASLSVGVLTGTSEVFSSGMDLKAFLKGETPIIEGRGLAGITERKPRKVLIAAVDGFALAGGCELALACDLIVASRNASFGLPEVKRGLVAGGGGVVNLPRRVTSAVALEMILTGDEISAERAYEIGLVNRITDGPSLDEALKLGLSISKNAPLALQASKEVVHESQNWQTSDLFKKQNAIIAPVFHSEDAREGARAFSEKREAVWLGK